MAAQNREQYQGFLIPDPRLNSTKALWSAESDYTEASPRAGQPAAAGDYEMVIEASGVQTAGATLDIQAIEGAGTGIDSRAGGFAWKASTDGDNAWRGWEAPATVSAFEAVDYGSSVGRKNPHGVTLAHPDYAGRVVVVTEAASASIEADYRNPTSGAWTNLTVHNGGSGGTGLPAYRPCLVEVGRRLYCLFFCRGDSQASDYYGIRVMVSTDGGESWEIARKFATIETDIVITGAGTGEYNAMKLRAAYSSGQVLVVAWLQEGVASGNADCFRQYASAELGLRLETVETWDPSSDDGGDFDLMVSDGYFVMPYVRNTGELYWRRLGSAYSPLTIAEELNDTSASWSGNFTINGASPTRITASDVAGCASDDGMLWLYLRYANSSAAKQHSVATLYSDDSGVTWTQWGIDPAVPNVREATSRWWNPEATDHYPENLAAIWQRGRVLIAHNYIADDNANDSSLMVAYLGGYSDLTLPPVRENLNWRNRATYFVTGLPYELSDDTAAWSNLGGGSAAYTVTLLSTGEEIVTGDGAGTNDNRYYQRTDSTTGDTAFIGEWTVESDADAITQRFVATSIRIDDGSRGVEASVRFSGTQIGIYDEVASSQLAALTTGSGGPWDVRVGMYCNEAASVLQLVVWYRASDTSEDRQWTRIGQYSLSDDGGSVGNNRVWYGNIQAGGATTQVTSVWQRKPHYTFGDITGLHGGCGSANFWHEWAPSADNPTSLQPRLFTPNWTYVDDGVSIRAVDGPAHQGDQWGITATSEYPIDRIFPEESRSPRVRWRSVDDDSDAEIALALDDELLGTDESHPGSPVWGLFLGGINWATATLYGYTSSAWTSIASIDMATGFRPLSFTREGASLVPNSDTFKNAARNEFAGWDARFITTSKVRRINGNSNGRWASTGSAGPRARLSFDGVDGTEPASGTMALRAREGCILFHLPAANTYSGFKIVIDAQPTVEGYFEIGTLMLGPVLVQGAPYGRGQQLNHVPGYERDENLDGTSVLRRLRPMAREVAVAWPDGVYISPWHSTSAEPDYRTTTDTSGVEGAAYRSGWVYDLVHSVRALNGAPLVYLPYIPRSDGSGDTIHLTRYWQQVYGHVDDSIEVTTQHGEEWATENLTVATMDIIEER